MPRECLKIIESKSKVRQTRAKAVVAKNQSPAPTPSTTPASVKAVAPNCVNQAPVYQALIPQTQRVSQIDFESYVKANYAILRNMQSQGTPPGNTITNPKEDLKGITTRSGVAYQGPKTPYQSKQGTKSQASVSEPVVATVSAPMPKLKPSIPYPSRRDNEKRRDQANEQIEKFYEIFKDMRMDECLALEDLGASINLMSFSVWEALLLSKLTPTCMTLELADRSVSKPIGIAKDVSFKVGVFQFPTDFVVVDFEPDPRVSLILRRCFLKTSRALIDVHKGELTLRIGKEAITYNLDQTVRYSANYDQMTANKIDVICEIYSQEVLGFSNVTASGSPTPDDDPIVSTTSPTLTPFGDNDFLLFEEADAFLGLEDDPDSPKINPFYYDPEGDILLLEAIFNSEPLHPLPNHEQYFPSYKKELKVCEAKTIKSSVDEPPEEDYKPAVQHQRRVNPKIHDVIKKEVEKLLDAGLIYPISDSPWVSPVHCVPKKGGFIMVENEENELIPTRLVIGWRVCIDYRKLNEATRKDHFPLLFMDQMLKRLAKNKYYCFLDGFSGYFQIPIDPRDQEKTTFTCPFGTFAYRRMPFGLCNAPGTFQRCMLAIFHDMVEKTMEVFMDDFSVFRNSFENYRSRLDKMLQRCEDTNLSLNWEKSHFMVKEGIVLGHKISKNRIEVDKAKIDVIAKLPHPMTVKGIRSFLGHKKLTEAPILIAPNWDLPFELMYDASDFAIGAVLGQRHEKRFKPIHYASKTMNDAKTNYTTTEKEMLAVVYAFENF
nr:reverse transcriptase domain-containing protein [Tanacetum cinerariifolium]